MQIFVQRILIDTLWLLEQSHFLIEAVEVPKNSSLGVLSAGQQYLLKWAMEDLSIFVQVFNDNLQVNHLFHKVVQLKNLTTPETRIFRPVFLPLQNLDMMSAAFWSFLTEPVHIRLHER